MIRKALAVLAAGLAGCAALGGGNRPPEWQARVDEVARLQARTDMRVDEVTRNLMALRERLDAQDAALKQAKAEKEVRDEPAEPPLQIVKVEPLPKEADTGRTAPGADVPGGARGRRAEPGSAPQESAKYAPVEDAASDLYRRAYSAFRDGRFGQAILDFEEFLRSYSDHEYADNAQYWIGECYYSQREFGEAIVEFGRVVERFPREGKASDAILKIGMSYYQLGEGDKAKAFWKRTASEYAGSEAAVQARKLLAAPP